MALKSALDIAMGKSNKIVDQDDIIKYTQEQQEQINELKKKYQSKIAQEEIMAQSKMAQIPPEELQSHHGELQRQISQMKVNLTLEMEEKLNRLIESFKK